MEAIRIAIAIGFFAIAGVAFYLFTPSAQTITLSDATLQEMGPGLALELTIQNAGPADVLVGLGSDFATQSILKKDDHTTFPIPGGSAPKLAMDGLHGMLVGLNGPADEGRLVPVTLWFKNAGAITTRARMSDSGVMDHGQVYTVPAQQAPPRMSATIAETNDGWIVDIEVENFELSRELVDGANVPGTGHAHLYLNGLKIQRVYESRINLGSLPPGRYELAVSLNTNDHKSIFSNGKLMVERKVFVVE